MHQKAFWPQQIQKTNDRFKDKYAEGHNYGLFSEHIENLQTLDIDQFKLPVFTEFVEFLFVNTDIEQYDNIMNKTDLINGEDRVWYKIFVESWRETAAIWYTYDHDVLLLELVLRNGLDSDKIINDLRNQIPSMQMQLHQAEGYKQALIDLEKEKEGKETKPKL